MGNGHTLSHESHGPHEAEAGAARAAVMWLAYSVAITAVVAVALVCVPFIVVWCLLFDAD